MKFSFPSNTLSPTQLHAVRLSLLGLGTEGLTSASLFSKASKHYTAAKRAKTARLIRHTVFATPFVWLQKILKPYTAKTREFVPNFLIFLSVLIAAVVFAPDLYYRFAPISTVEVKAPDSGTPLGGDFNSGAWFRSVVANSAQFISNASSDQNSQNGQAAQTQTAEEKPPQPSRYLPSQDKTLPEGDWLIIPAIGVRTELLHTDNPEEALMEGVWKVPEYGEPGQLDKPIILAAHRFGWEWWWQSDYWRYNSFYLLPDTQPGDVVEIISDQRKWVYEIYAGEEGSEITDYDADMILYTCKFLTSPVRHFRYARLIDVDADTQG